MELCGGENRYREGRLIDVWLPTLKLYILTILRAKVLRAKALRPCQLNLTVWRSKCQNYSGLRRTVLRFGASRVVKYQLVNSLKRGSNFKTKNSKSQIIILFRNFVFML